MVVGGQRCGRTWCFSNSVEIDCGVIGWNVKMGSDGTKLWDTRQALVRLLPQLKKQGHRPLIFSQWTNMLDILEWALAVMGFRFTRLDGRYRTLCSS